MRTQESGKHFSKSLMCVCHGLTTQGVLAGAPDPASAGGIGFRRKLGRILIMTNAIKQSGAYLEIVSFHLGDQEFCIDIMAIREIRGWAPVTPMPHTPPYVLGLINLRGAVIPVIDMACRLGMKMTEPSERSAIIVTDIAGKLVGLLVEQVSDMMTIKSEALQPAPEIIPEAQRAFCRGIVALEKTMVCFLNLDTVIADELAQAA